MARTILQTIDSALMQIGARGEAEVISPDMVQDAKVTLQELIASWSASGLIIPYLSRTIRLGDNTKASYTWGPGGDINSVAPVDVAAVSFVLENSQYPLKPADETLFMGRRILGTVGMPNWFYYERQTPLPFLHFDVAPYGGLFKITSTMAMDDTLELTDDLELPPFYSRMVVYNLAIELCPQYDREPSAALVSIAMRAMNIVKSRNLVVPSQTLEVPSGGFGRTSDLDYGMGS